MSRNFELLERLQQDQELFRIPAVTKKDHAHAGPTNHNSSLVDLDRFAREEVLRLVQGLFLATNGNGRQPQRRVVFCGVDVADGSNLLCAQVSRSLAEQVQAQVCLVDANIRMPGPKPLFDLAAPDDLPQSEFKTDLPQSEFKTTDYVLQRITDNLWLLSTDLPFRKDAPPNLDRMRELIGTLGDKFPYVVISAPPMGLCSDAAILGQSAEGVVLVLEANSTRRVSARKAKRALEAANVRMIGAVLNNRTFPIPEVIYRKI